MKIKDFQYSRKDGVEKNYKLLILNEDKEYLKGISLSSLSKEEEKALMKIIEDYEEKLKPFMKHYRQFIVENILENKDGE